jgi:hypothetical protein
MTINCNLTESDYRAMRRYLFFRYRKFHWFFILAWIWVAVVNWRSYRPDATMIQKVFGLVAVTVIWIATIFISWVVWKILIYMTGSRFRASIGPHVYDISEDGLVESNTDGRKEIKVSGLKHVAETGAYFFIFAKTGMGYVIPKKDLTSFDELHALQSKVVSNLKT